MVECITEQTVIICVRITSLLLKCWNWSLLWAIVEFSTFLENFVAALEQVSRCHLRWALLFNSVSYHSDLRIPHTCSWCQKLDKRSSRFVVILGLKSKILKVTTLFEWRRWRKCQKSWLLLEGELMKTFWTRLINQCRWKNMILILKGRVWPGGCYWKSGSGQWEVPSDILENWELWLLATTLHIYMSDSLLLSHIFKSYSIRYVTREELVAAMEKVTQGLREEIRSFFQAFSCGWHHQWRPLSLMISVWM